MVLSCFCAPFVGVNNLQSGAEGGLLQDWFCLVKLLCSKAMTVTGLWPLLQKRGIVRSARGADARQLLEGKRIAIDVSCWAVQGSVMEHASGQRPSDTRCQHFLAISFWRVTRYLRLGCFPLAVVEGLCPKAKRRRRDRDGEFQRSVKLVGELFVAMGCPIVAATGEAEECCAKMVSAGLVDAIECPDSDLFPFGATGLLLKSVERQNVWSIEYVDFEAVFASVGLHQHGWISLAALAGCDFLPAGCKGVGAEKALHCVFALVKHFGDDASLKDHVTAALDMGLPAELQKFSRFTGCQSCKRCGHGTIGKLKHGALGCLECKTTKSQGGRGGCLPRAAGACPCDFHQHYDFVVLARVFATPDSLPPSSLVRLMWETYEGTPLDDVDVTWTRPDMEACWRFLSIQCGSPRAETIKYMLPAVLVYDLLHPNNLDTVFVPSAVAGECVVGLAPEEKSNPTKSLAVVQWTSAAGCDVDAELLHMLNQLPRPKRCISKQLALRHIPGLVEEYCRVELARRAHLVGLKASSKNKEHWLAEARAVCCDFWLLPVIPNSIVADIDVWVDAWSRQVPKRQRSLNSFFKQSPS